MKGKQENQNSSKKSIVFFTHAPQGTLGDPSAASKLIKQLKQNYGDDIDVSIVLIVDKNNEKKVQAIFKDIKITTITQETLNLQYKGPDIKGVPRDVNQIINKADAVIFFPTFHFMAESQIEKIGQYKKPTFIVTEYDLHEQNRAKQSKKIDRFKARWLAIDTGLSSDKLGIFSTEENNQNTKNPLSSIDKKDSFFRDLLLNGHSEDKYQDSHQLFFGYFNKLNMESNDNTVDPMVFIEGCLAKASPEKKHIDIVLPILTEYTKEQGGSDVKNYKNIGDISQHFIDNPSLIQGYKVEFWNKNTKGEMTCLKELGEGDKVIRLINGYPFTPNTMNSLMKASDPFVLVTGDQSLSEAISNEKIFLYQTMGWKKELWEGLKNEVSHLLGKESKLYEFLVLQETKPKASIETFKDFFQHHEDTLKNDMSKLHNHIFLHRNLYKTLPAQLMTYIEKPNDYLTHCLENTDNLKYKHIKELFKIYPDNIHQILDILINKNKCSLEPKQLIKAIGHDHEFYSRKEFLSIFDFFYQKKFIKQPSEEILNKYKGDPLRTIFLSGISGGTALGGIVGAFLAGPVGIIVGAAVSSLISLVVVGASILIVQSVAHLFNLGEAEKKAHQHENKQEIIPNIRQNPYILLPSSEDIYSKKTEPQKKHSEKIGASTSIISSNPNLADVSTEDESEATQNHL